MFHCGRPLSVFSGQLPFHFLQQLFVTFSSLFNSESPIFFPHYLSGQIPLITFLQRIQTSSEERCYTLHPQSKPSTPTGTCPLLLLLKDRPLLLLTKPPVVWTSSLSTSSRTWWDSPAVSSLAIPVYLLFQEHPKHIHVKTMEKNNNPFF